MIDQLLKQAVEAHRSSKLQKAESLYRLILEENPEHPDANHYLGLIFVNDNKIDEALIFLKTALEANFSQSQFWLSYIDALIKAKKLDDAKILLSQGEKAGLDGVIITKIYELFLQQKFQTGEYL